MKNCIFSGSTRKGGNCDFASRIIVDTLGSGEIHHIAQQNILGCRSCGYCNTNVGKCVISNAREDNSEFFFQTLFDAETTFFVSPIYFYSVPSQLKAFLDRAQAWFHMPREARPGKNRNCGIILLGAREQGDKLFEGASLTFKYALDALGYRCLDPLCIYGVDKESDLAQNADACASIVDYTQKYKP